MCTLEVSIPKDLYGVINPNQDCKPNGFIKSPIPLTTLHPYRISEGLYTVDGSRRGVWSHYISLQTELLFISILFVLFAITKIIGFDS